MKLVPLLAITLLCITNLTLAQNKETCDSEPQPIIEDLSNITKCSIKEVKDENNNSKSELQISYRKVRRRNTASPVAVEKKEKETAHSVNATQKEIASSFVTNSLEIKKTIGSKEVLFSVVDEVPLFSKCVSNKVSDKRKCFNKQISKHFAKNFYPERASDESIKGKVFILFTIDFQGYISDIQIKSQKKSPALEKEIKRVVNKLPKLSPGLHQGLPVNVKYSLPININLN